MCTGVSQEMHKTVLNWAPVFPAIPHLRASAGHQLHQPGACLLPHGVPAIDEALPQYGGCTQGPTFLVQYGGCLQGAPQFLKANSEKRSCHPSILKTTCRTQEWNPCPPLPTHTRQPPHQGRAAVFCQCPKCESRQRFPALGILISRE